jgi:hypothetical protein
MLCKLCVSSQELGGRTVYKMPYRANLDTEKGVY